MYVTQTFIQVLYLNTILRCKYLLDYFYLITVVTSQIQISNKKYNQQTHCDIIISIRLYWSPGGTSQDT